MWLKLIKIFRQEIVTSNFFDYFIFLLCCFLYCSYIFRDAFVLSNSLLNLLFSTISQRTENCLERFFLTSFSLGKFVKSSFGPALLTKEELPPFLFLFDLLTSLGGINDSCSWANSVKACWGETLEWQTWWLAVFIVEMLVASVETAGW